jgi:hypothetical protein
VLLLAPIWGFPCFLTQDGPTHVENARILLDYGRPDFEELRVFYVLQKDPFPNWLSHLALAGLMTVASPLLAEKLFLTAYVLLLPLAFRYALGALRPEARGLWPLVLPFVYNHFLHLGFYNLAFAAIPFFLVLGFWLSRGGRLGPGETASLGLLLLGLYFCHLITLLLTLGALGVLALWVSLALPGAGETSLRDAGGGDSPRWRTAGARGFALGLAALPAVFLVARFLGRQQTDPSEPGPTFLERWSDLWRLRELASHDPRELWLTSLLGVGTLVAVAWALAARRRAAGDETTAPARPAGSRDGLLLVAAAYAAVYFLAPVTALSRPGSTTHDRVSLYVFLALVLWLAAEDLGPRSRKALVAMSLALTAGLVALRFPHYAEMNDLLAEYLSVAERLPRHATLLPISFSHQGRRPDGTTVSWRVEAFLHAGAYLAVNRGLVDLTNYEADLTYFPTLFRREANPYRWLRGGQETDPPCVDLGRYDRHAPRPLDFVLVWGAAYAGRSDPCTQAMFKHLEERYERIATSAPRGLVELFRRR